MQLGIIKNTGVFAKKLFGLFHVCGVCLFASIKSPYVHGLIVNFYLRAPFSISTGCRTAKPSISFAVFSILLTRHIPQVFDTVVPSIAVYMIEFMSRPNIVNKRPCQMMSVVTELIDHYPFVPAST